jgi:hypothetical protein
MMRVDARNETSRGGFMARIFSHSVYNSDPDKAHKEAYDDAARMGREARSRGKDDVEIDVVRIGPQEYHLYIEFEDET